MKRFKFALKFFKIFTMKRFIWLFVFITFYANAQDTVEVNLSNPHATIYSLVFFTK